MVFPNIHVDKIEIIICREKIPKKRKIDSEFNFKLDLLIGFSLIHTLRPRVTENFC